MGWDNPQIPWRELERRLSGRPQTPWPELAGGRRRRLAGLVAQAARLRAAAGSPGRSATGPLRRAARALVLQLPRRRVRARGARRGGRPARPRGADPHRPRRRVRRGPVRRGGRGVRAAHRRSAPSCRSTSRCPHAGRARRSRPGSASPIRPGTHLLALARDPDGYAALSRVIGTGAPARRGEGPSGLRRLDEIAEAADGHWLVLTGCRKGAVRRALDARRRRRGPAARWPGSSSGSAATTSPSSSPTNSTRSPTSATTRSPRWPTSCGCELVATTAAHYHGPPRRPLATALAAVRARTSLDEIDGWLPAWAGQHLRSGAEMAQRFARWPSAVATAARLAKEIAFPLELIAPGPAAVPVPAGARPR